METNDQLRELAQILANEFEKLRIKAKEAKSSNGDKIFTIAAAPPNIIAIKLPAKVNVKEFTNYSDKVFGLVDSIITEVGFKLKQGIEIHIYEYDGTHYDARRIYPKNVN